MSRMIALVVLAAAAVSLAVGALPEAAPGADLPCTTLTRFSPLNFPAIPTVDSRLLPLVPGTQRVYQGRSNVSGQSLPHQVIFTVTDLTKVIGGVRTVIVHDVDVSSGVVTEEELSFWAQDTAGNVWNIGEYPEEHLPNGILRAPAAWMASTDGAVPGIHMPAVLPPVDGPFYVQGSVPKIGFLDCAQTSQVNTTACVPAGCFNGVMIFDEDSPLDAGSGIQRKSYAPGIGIVAIGFIDDPQGEALELTQFNHLDEPALARIRDAALEQDARGHATNPAYSRSPLAELPARQAVTPIADSSSPDLPSTPARPSHAARAGRVSLSLARSGRRSSVRVLCSLPAGRAVAHPGTCRGSLEVVSRGRRVGSARFSVPGGLARTVHLRLRGVGARRTLAVLVRTRGAHAGDRPVAVSRALKLRT
jgi:hypothetical protein